MPEIAPESTSRPRLHFCGGMISGPDLKFSFTDQVWRTLLAKPILAELADQSAQIRTLRCAYFDTADHVLYRSGISLSVLLERRVWRQVVRMETRDAGSNPEEVEAALGSGEPDLGAVSGATGERLRGLVGNEPLHAVFETVICRSIWQVATPDGGAVKAVFDEGEIRAESAALELREARLELNSGDAATLLSVAVDLVGDINFGLNTESHAERGYRLLRGENAPQHPPEKGAGQALSDGENCAEAFAAACHSATRQILHNWEVVSESSDPEGPHQLRIGLRRLRTALSAFRPVIDSPDLRQLAREARDLARCVGEVRDLDVLCEEIVGPLSVKTVDEAGFRALHKLLRSQTAKRRSRMQRELRGARWSPLRLRLALLPHGAGWTQDAIADEHASRPVEEQARLAMQKEWRRARRKAHDLDRLSIEERHELRKRLKSLRYTAEFFASLYPGAEMGRFLKRLRRLLDVFGYLNDVAMAERLIDLCRAERQSDSGRDIAAGYVVGWHSARSQQAWETVPRRWRELKRSLHYWM